jgi:hypothetical protein
MARQADNVIEAKGALILGAGLAGLFTALKLAPFPALVLCGARVGTTGSSVWAQGGIAAAVGEGDTWQSHAVDTIAAGAGLCDPDIAALVAREASARIDDLVGIGAPFDRDSNGRIAVAREAAHSAARIVHVSGDRAGAEITRTLAEKVLATPSVEVMEGFHAVELAMEDGRVVGLFARYGNGVEMKLVLFRAPAVIFATGGLGALYAVTTNPLEARGEGLGMAARAGALIADPEFVQFHPTAIAIGRDPAPLATEALRGEGAILIDETGRRFMPAVHPSAELAPRDVVARAIHREIAKGHKVFLDCREAIGEKFAEHFPTVNATCLSAGIDPARAHSCGAGRALSHGRHRQRCARTHLARRSVGRGRMRLDGSARRQPARLELAARSARVRCTRGRRCENAHCCRHWPGSSAGAATLHADTAAESVARCDGATCGIGTRCGRPLPRACHHRRHRTRERRGTRLAQHGSHNEACDSRRARAR